MKDLKITVFGILVLTMLSSTAIFAQSTFGLRGGLNATNVSLDNLPNRSERFGLHIGVFANLPLVPDFMSLQPEISYSTKGTAFKPLNNRVIINMNYVDLFLPISFQLGSIDLQVGPFASYLTSPPNYEIYNDNRVVTNAFKKGDAGLTAGIVFNISKFFFGFRFSQGFVDLVKSDAKPLLGSGKSSVGQASIGYKF
jgi:hypothetical protein